MAESTLVYNPVAPSQNKPQQILNSLDELRGKVVGFIDNTKPNFNSLVDDLAELLVNKYGVAKIIKHRKSGPSSPATDMVLEDLTKQCDVVITGSGD